MADLPQTTVLMVEDHTGAMRLQQSRLEECGYYVKVAATPQEALAVVREDPIDLVLLAQRLPEGLSGLDLYEQMKDAGVETPVILLTDPPGDGIVLQSFRAGVCDLVPRTADYLDQLIPVIEGALGRRKADRGRIESMATENDRLCQELRHIDRLKDEFLAMLAHELRNPLAPIRNALNLIRLEGHSGAAPEEENWAIIDRQVSHLVRLVDDLLDVSRISKGNIQLHMAPLDLVGVAIRGVESSQPLIDSRRHTLRVTAPKKQVPVQGDDVRLIQVLTNLLNNAATYTPEGGHIDLIIERTKREAVVRVRDTGVGIPAEMLPRLFDLFTQSQRALDRAEGGLGIGLTLVRRLTEMHGGSVEARSEGSGKGSEFIVRLPLFEGSVPLPVASTPAEVTPMMNRRRILVVDDNQDSTKTLTRLLQVLGHEVSIAHNGMEAVEVAERYRPEIILLDIGLPGMDGYAVCSRLRARPEFGNTVLVALTGYGSPEDRERSQHVGFNAHLVKPIDLDTLKQILSQPISLLHKEG